MYYQDKQELTTSVKIVLIGAGSATFAVRVITDLMLTPGLSGSHMVLVDIDEARLSAMRKMAERLAVEMDSDITFSMTTDRIQALQGADFVINTALYGGHHSMESQRALAEAHGYYRGCKIILMPNMKLMLDIARDIERICPSAWLIQSSNPVFEGVTLITRMTKVKTIGLCHGHFGYYDIARVLGLDSKYVTGLSCGLNHRVFLYSFLYRGKDAYPLLDEWIKTKSEQYWSDGKNLVTMSPAAIHQYKLFGLMPVGDTPRGAGWWYNSSLEVKRKWYNQDGGMDSEIGWGRLQENIRQKIRVYEELANDPSKSIKDTLKCEKSKEQIVPIIDSLANNNEQTYMVNIPNSGDFVPGFPRDLVVECPAVINGAGVFGVQTPPLPDGVMHGDLLRHWNTSEMMCKAIMNRDYNMMLLYILHEQRTQSLDQAEAFLKEWINHPTNEIIRSLFA